MSSPSSEFERALRPHLAAAYNLARWLTRTESDAEDVLQDAALRAFRFFGRSPPDNPRAWFLRIVRNCCYDLHGRRGRAPGEATLDEEAEVVSLREGPDAQLLRLADGEALRQAMERLAPEYREAFLLREVEGLSYKDIAEVSGAPIGTVMSRLSRARVQLRAFLTARRKREEIA